MVTQFIFVTGRKPVPFKPLMAALSGHLSTADQRVRIEPLEPRNRRSKS